MLLRRGHVETLERDLASRFGGMTLISLESTRKIVPGWLGASVVPSSDDWVYAEGGYWEPYDGDNRCFDDNYHFADVEVSAENDCDEVQVGDDLIAN
jgi:hypothetical protein